MNINFCSNLKCYSTYFLQKTYVEAPKRQTVVALIAFVALSCLTYGLICLSRKKNRPNEKGNIKLDFTQQEIFDQNASEYFNQRVPQYFPPDDVSRYFDQDASQFDILSVSEK
jgi:hypothetical protein